MQMGGGEHGDSRPEKIFFFFLNRFFPEKAQQTQLRLQKEVGVVSQCHTSGRYGGGVKKAEARTWAGGYFWGYRTKGGGNPQRSAMYVSSLCRVVEAQHCQQHIGPFEREPSIKVRAMK